MFAFKKAADRVPQEVADTLGLSKEQSKYIYVSDTDLYQAKFQPVEEKTSPQVNLPEPPAVKKKLDWFEESEEPDEVQAEKEAVEKTRGAGSALAPKCVEEPKDTTSSPVAATPKLVQIHYMVDHAGNPNTLVSKYRGWIVDVEEKKVVCHSFPFTPIISMKQRNDMDEKTRLYVAREGTVVRVFMWKGKVWFSTHRRLDCTRSFYSTWDVSFFQMFLDAAKEKGFDVEKMKRGMKPDTWFVFFVIHPENQTTNSAEVAPDLLHLATYTNDGKEVKQTDFRFEGLAPKELDEAQAWKLYAEGTPLISIGKDGVPFKVHPESYTEALRVRGNTPNIKQQWFSLLDTGEEDKLKTVLPASKHKQLDNIRREMNTLIELDVKDLYPREGTLVNFLMDRYIEWVTLRVQAAKKGVDAETQQEARAAFEAYEHTLTEEQLYVVINMKQEYARRASFMRRWEAGRKNAKYVVWMRALLRKLSGPRLFKLIRDFMRARIREEKFLKKRLEEFREPDESALEVTQQVPTEGEEKKPRERVLGEFRPPRMHRTEGPISRGKDQGSKIPRSGVSHPNKDHGQQKDKKPHQARPQKGHAHTKPQTSNRPPAPRFSGVAKKDTKTY